MDLWTQIKNRLGISKDLGILGFSDIVGSGMTSILWFYLASIMSTESYGEIHFMIGIASTSSLISLLVTPTAVTVYVSKNLKFESTMYFISMIGGIISSVVIMLLFSRIDVALLLLGFIINDLSLAYLLGKKYFKKYSKFLLLQKLSAVILCILLYYLIGNTGVIFGLFLSYVPLVLIIINGFKESKIDFSLLTQKKQFLIHSYLISMAALFRNHADKLIVGALLGYSLLGNYALAFQFIAVFMILPNIVSRFILPDDSRNIANRKLKFLTILVSLFISIFGIFIMPSIISLIFPQYIESVILIQIMSLGIPFATLGLLISSKLLGTEQSKYVLIGRWIAAISMTVGVIVLGNWYGAIGLASTFVLSNVLLGIYLIIITRLRIHSNFL